MNELWVDRNLKLLNREIGIFKGNSSDFFFEPTPIIYKILENADDEDLQKLACEIIKHLDLSYFPIVGFDWGIRMDLETAGQVTINSNTKIIRIPMFYAGRKYALGAILSHEISHIFLDYKRISLPDLKENEMLTDLTSIFIGLGKLMLNGLMVNANEIATQKTLLGYLSPQMMAYAFRKVASFRGIVDEVAFNNLVLEAKTFLAC